MKEINVSIRESEEGKVNVDFGDSSENEVANGLFHGMLYADSNEAGNALVNIVSKSLAMLIALQDERGRKAALEDFSKAVDKMRCMMEERKGQVR